MIVVTYTPNSKGHKRQAQGIIRQRLVSDRTLLTWGIGENSVTLLLTRKVSIKGRGGHSTEI